MTILSIAQTCANRLHLPTPATFIGSVDNNMVNLKTALDRCLRDLRDDYPWPQMVREHTFTLATNTQSYALPADYDETLSGTFWNRSQTFPLMGPVDDVSWQEYKSGQLSSLPRERFRIKGWSSTQFFIDPTPTSAENGQTVAYEYLSRTVIRPKTWAASTSWTGLQYCSYNGNIYDRGAVTAATTGTVAPTHTTGSASDGTVTWTYRSTAYETITSDTDETILDEKIVIDGTEWRFLQSNGFEYQDIKAGADLYLEAAKTKLQSADVVSFAVCAGVPSLLSRYSYPEGNY